MRKTLFSILLCLFLPIIAHSATIFSYDLATGTTCNGTNLNDGVFTSGVNDDCTYNLGIGAGGPGDRNYLKLLFPSSDSTTVLKGASSLSNPQDAYVRFWFRLLTSYTSESSHPMFIGESDGSNYGFALFRGSAHTNTFSMFPDYSEHVYYYQPGVSLSTWYRLEYRIQGGGSSSCTVTARLDGNDVTSNFISDTNGTTLTSRNGSITCETLNYPYFATYQISGMSGELIDIAGFEISNSGWLGGDADSTAPEVTADDSTKSISADSYSAEGDATDAVGVSGCKWRLGSAPDAGNGTACTGATAWTCSTSGYSEGANTLYIGCYDAAGNYGTDTVIVTYTIPEAAPVTISGGSFTGCSIR